MTSTNQSQPDAKFVTEEEEEEEEEEKEQLRFNSGIIGMRVNLKRGNMMAFWDTAMERRLELFKPQDSNYKK